MRCVRWQIQIPNKNEIYTSIFQHCFITARSQTAKYELTNESYDSSSRRIYRYRPRNFVRSISLPEGHWFHIDMANKLFEEASKLPWVKSLEAPNDDTHSDRLNHRYTVCFLVICAVIATGSPIAFNRINCWVPANFIGAFSTYTNNYCWISNTYYIPTNDSLPRSKLARDKAEIGYYQWAPFYFLLSALLFYLPRMLWRSMNTRSGIDLQFLVKKGDENADVAAIQYYCEPKKNESGIISRCLRSLSCTGGKRLGNYLSTVHLITKGLYLANSLLQLVLVQVVLGQPGWLYGFDIWYSVFIKNSVLTDSPYFPRVTMCDLRVREVGNLHRYTVQCVLPINMLNEKTFTLAWFWFFYMFLVNLVSFLHALFYATVPSYRFRLIHDLYRISTSKPIGDEQLFRQFTYDFLRPDGVLILRIIHLNGTGFLASQVVNRLYENYENDRRGNELGGRGSLEANSTAV